MSNSCIIKQKTIYRDSEYVVLYHREERRPVFLETPGSMRARSKQDADHRSLMRFRKKILHNLEVNNVRLRSFWTLTFDEEHITNTKEIRKFFNRMKTYYRKKQKDSLKKFVFSYFWRLEYGEKTGRKHFHFMTSERYLPYDKVKSWWGQGNPWFVKIDSKKKAVTYVLKYSTKREKEVRPLLSNERRFGCSRDFKKVPSTGKYIYMGNVDGYHLDKYRWLIEQERPFTHDDLSYLVANYH